MTTEKILLKLTALIVILITGCTTTSEDFFSETESTQQIETLRELPPAILTHYGRMADKGMPISPSYVEDPCEFSRGFRGAIRQGNRYRVQTEIASYKNIEVVKDFTLDSRGRISNVVTIKP